MNSNKNAPKLIESTKRYQGFLEISRETWKIPCFDNTRKDMEIVREVVTGDQSTVVAALPVCPKRRVFAEIRQWRVGPADWISEIVAGHVNPGEMFPDAVAREFMEELGVEPLALYHIGSLYTSPGVSNEYCQLYLASYDAELDGKIVHNPKEQEDIMIQEHSFNDLDRRINLCYDMKTRVALCALKDRQDGIFA